MSSYSYQQQKDSRDRDTWTCCCGPFQTHVETGAYVIAFLGCALSGIEAYASFMSTSDHHDQNFKTGVMYLLSAVMYLSIIAAQQQRRPGFYVPYLVFMGVSLILATLVCVLLTGIAIVAPQYMTDKEDPETVEKFRLLFGISALALWLSIALHAWFYSIIYRAYKFMKLDNGQYGGGTAGQFPPV